MSRVNFEMDSKTKTQFEQTIKRKGYKTVSEFFRQKAREVMENG